MLFNVHAVLMMKKLSIKHSVLLPPLTMIVAMMATMRGRRTSKMAIMMQAATSLSHLVHGTSTADYDDDDDDDGEEDNDDGEEGDEEEDVQDGDGNVILTPSTRHLYPPQGPALDCRRTSLQRTASQTFGFPILQNLHKNKIILNNIDITNIVIIPTPKKCDHKNVVPFRFPISVELFV